MILYKYVSFETARLILENNALQFSRCDRFNDPFDAPRYPTVHDEVDMRGNLARITREWQLRENTGLLCLTRTPTNPLMWAHYADSHQGVVLGLDAVRAGLTDATSNLIPAQFGSIVYASRQPSWGYFTGREPEVVGETFGFEEANFERLQRLFLTKPIHWAYEEEVRVAKCLHGLTGPGETTTISGLWTMLGAGAQARHLYQLPPGSVREVHFGIRTDTQATDDLRTAMSGRHPEVRWRDCILGLDGYDVRSDDHVTIAEALDL